MSEPLIDLRALLVEREEFEGSMVTKLREGLAQGGSQVKSLRDIHETLNKRMAAAAPAQQKKLHLKLGVTQFFLGHTAHAVEHLKHADGPLAAFFLGRALALRGEYDDALKAFEKAEKSGYAAQQVQLQKAGVLRLQGSIGEAKAILTKLKDMAAHNAEYHHQEGGLAEAEGDTPRAARSYERASELDPSHTGALFRLGFLNDLAGNDYDAINYYEKCLKYPPVGKGVLYNLGVLYEDNGQFDKAADCYRRLKRADPTDERAKLFTRDAEASMTQTYSPDDEVINQQMSKVMEVPITDFELSVRSRNCLKRMNIRTLGDLTRVTEPQLLASKNFGETSLAEIKIMSVRARKCMQRLAIATLGELCQRTADELLEAKNFGITSLNEVREKLTGYGLKLRGD